MNFTAAMAKGATAPSWGHLGDENMDELRQRLEELRVLVATIAANGQAEGNLARDLKARVDKIEDRVDAIMLEQKGLVVKMGAIVGAIVLLANLLPTIAEFLK